MSEENKIKLTNEDWDILLPGEEYTIGNTKIFIRPLGLEKLAKTLDALTKLLTDWKDVIEAEQNRKQGISRGKNKKPETIIERLLTFFPKISSMIQQHGIDIISDLSEIDESDVKRLPAKASIDLFNKCLEINIKSQEGLEKNLEGLADQIVKLTGNQAKQEQSMETVLEE